MTSFFRIFHNFFLLLFLLSACTKDDNRKSWGIPVLYMPQAELFDGGTTNDYPVPLNNNPTSLNYVYDSAAAKLVVPLSVYRSGLGKGEACTVTIQVDADTAQQILTSSAISDAVLLPPESYVLPASINLTGDARESFFNLSVDLGWIAKNYPDYYNNQMILAVRITDPSKYELNPKLSTAIVIIDGKTFLPNP